MRQQGASMKWEEAMEQKVIWQDDPMTPGYSTDDVFMEVRHKIYA